MVIRFTNFLYNIHYITIMFVAYSINNKQYGYMCFKHFFKIKIIYNYIESCLWKQKINIIYTRVFSNIPIYAVTFYNDGKHKIEYMKTTIKDVEDVNEVYTYLYKKYGYSNILGFL